MNSAVLHKLRVQGSSFVEKMRVRQLTRFARGLQPRQIHLLAVFVPMLLVSAYRLFIESDRFASETQIVVMNNESPAQDKLGLGFLSGSAVSHQDAKLVQGFIHSLDMLKYLDQKIHLLDHFRSNHIDFFSSLSRFLTLDEALDYYQDLVHLKFDETSGVITIEAEAFTPEFAALMAQTIIDRSEEFINQIDNDLAKNRMDFIGKELKASHAKMQDAKQNMMSFASRNGLVEPEEQSKSLIAVVNELNAELTREEALLKQLLSFMNPNAPDVVALRAKINAIKSQIQGEQGTFADTEQKGLGQLRAQHHDLILAFNFAQDTYKATLAAWEKARVDSFQKDKYLVKITSPDQPQYAKYPRRLRNVLSALLVISVIYGIAVLGFEILREHRS